MAEAATATPAGASAAPLLASQQRRRLSSVGAEQFEESYWTRRSSVDPTDCTTALAAAEPRDDGPGSVLGSAITLVTTCIGTGLLALPFAFANVGLGAGLLVLAFFVAVSMAASHLLCRCCEWARVYSYEEIMVAAFGGAGAVSMEVVVIWLLLGAMTSLLVVVGDALSLVAVQGLGRTHLVLLAVLIIILPLSSAQSVYSLRYSNAMAIGCTLLVAAALVARGLAEAAGGKPAAAPTAGGSALLSLPIIMLSVGCQVQVPGVYGELRGRSLRRMGAALLAAGALCFCLYGAVATAGLRVASAAAAVPGNVLDCFPAGDATALVMRVSMGVAVMLVYPMLCLPCRSTVDHLLCGGGAAFAPPSRLARARQAVETLAIVGATTRLATANQDLASVFGFTGATAGALICYLLPPACYLRLRRERPDAEQSSTRGEALLGLLMLVGLAPLCLVITWRELMAR
mmetsp:Transcript_38290/g.106709  ORF Transcript_38290/g.106709 Transcript_38290/m.106709 type:complete len:459 (-) Transcript_38290:89-1465(-)